MLEQKIAQILGEQTIQLLGLSLKLEEAQARIKALEAEAEAKAPTNGKAAETPTG